MRSSYLWLAGLAVIVLLIQFAQSALIVTDNLGVATPSQNGTSFDLNVTSRMQQYVGYFGNVVTMVRL
ncbi:MAG: hypothetical protein AABX01_04540, partial [Candidatus Micrarchaeota archaeon]